jgi:hypothetical protein
MNLLQNFKKLETDTIKSFLFNKSILSVAVWMFILTSAYSIVAGTLLLCPVQDVLLNILFQFFLVTVPGLAVSVTWFSEKHDPILCAGLSYAFGYVIVIIEYLAAMSLGRQYSLPTALLVFALACVLLWRKKDDLQTSHPEEKVSKGILFVFLVVLITSFFCYSVHYGGANLTNLTAIPTDIQYWLGNATSLSISFPAVVSRFSSDTLYYYYFPSIQLAFQSNVTGISIYSLGIVYYSLHKSLLLFGGVYAALRSLKLNNKCIIFALIACVLSSGIEVINQVTVASHMMIAPFSYDIGIGCGCWMLYFVIEQYHKRVFDIKMCLGAVVFMAAACGSKAPSALVFMSAAGIICFGWLFGKDYKKAFSYGLGILTAFFLIFFVFITPPTSAGVSARSGGFTPFQLMGYNAVLSSYYNNSILFIFPKFLELPAMVMLFLFADPLPAFFEMVGILHMVKWKKARTSVYWGFAISILIAEFIGIFWFFDGKSNMYFSMTGRLLSMMFGTCLFSKEIDNIKLSLSRNFSSLLAVLLCFQVGLFYFVGFDEGCLKSMGRGTKKIVDVYTDNADIHTDNISEIKYFSRCRSYTTKDKVEALDWIRKNTEKDSLIATNESISQDLSFYYKDPKANYMYSPVFSERINYLEGYVYIRAPKAQEEVARRNDLLLRTYNNDKKALLQIKKEGVDYIVCDRRKYPLFTPTPKYTTTVFRNGSITVYRIK